MTNLDRFKLRAWHREQKRMFEVHTLCLYAMTPHIQVLSNEPGEAPFDYSLEAVDLLQTPGLKDKNGVLIFEGDILTVLSQRFEKFLLTFNEELCEWDAVQITMDIPLAIDWWPSEIIGNKYENPELLAIKKV